jgi:hypothetical protein
MIDQMNNPWLTYQWNEAVSLWGEQVDTRLEMMEREMVAAESIPQGMTIKYVPKYDLLGALGYEEDGSPINIEERQYDRLTSRFGVTRHEGPMPDHIREAIE